MGTDFLKEGTMTDILVLDSITGDEFLRELFEHEYCAECGGDVQHHDAMPLFGHWFARCRRPLAAGTIVLTQHGGQEHTGLVLDEPSPFGDDWIVVDWEHVGEWDEYIDDVTVVGRGF